MDEILREQLDAPERVIQDFLRYGELLKETNAVTNLTAIRDDAGIARLHFLDSAALRELADFSGRDVIDVGTGAGFPGLPLRLLQPDMRLTLLDANNKKVEFLRGVCAELAPDVRCLWGRAEELGELRESFDIAVSRAVAELEMLAELCLPLVRDGGLFIAMKKPDCDAEVQRADSAIRALGGRLRGITRYTVPGTDVEHAAVLIDKLKPTPAQYPRRWAQIKKKPLGGERA